MIEVEHLCKKFTGITAVDDLSFQVQPGEVLGFLGPNGAGKSTSMKMLAGFLKPTSGTARIFGHDVQIDSLAARRLLGYLPEGAPSYGEMTVARFLDFIATVRGLEGAIAKSAIARVVDQLHLGKVLRQNIDTLSKGFKRRVGLAQAIVHDPKVLILDEPTDGLDPNQKHEVRELINSMARDKTIIISTHILEEVHALCSRAMIISSGRLLADDTPDALEGKSRYHQAVSLKADSPANIREAIAALPAVASVELDERDNTLTAFPEPGQAIFQDIAALARDRQWQVASMQLESGRLDEVFREITRGSVN